ncbi:MAG: complex I subunit 1 family protein [Candidatus Woesearchaeota archaeon]
MNLDLSIANVVFILLIVPFALLMEGVRRKVIARMQHRVGPPVWQPFYDVLKLLKKGETRSLANENWFYRWTPFLYFITTIVLFMFIPLAMLSFEYDFILLIYLLVLDSALYVLAGFASNNPYSTIGSMREMVVMVCYEMIFTVAIVAVMVAEKATSLAEIGNSFILFKVPLAAICLFYVVLIEVRVTPYDTVEAGTEILESVKTEYYGRNLAYMELSKDLKTTFFAMLWIFLFIGVHNILLFLALTVLMVWVLGFTQATTCRYRLDQVLKRYTFVLGIALFELARIMLFGGGFAWT